MQLLEKAQSTSEERDITQLGFNAANVASQIQERNQNIKKSSQGNDLNRVSKVISLIDQYRKNQAAVGSTTDFSQETANRLNIPILEQLNLLVPGLGQSILEQGTTQEQE